MKHIDFFGKVGMVAMITVLMMLTGCEKNIAVSGITISSTAETLEIGSTVSLSYNWQPSDATIDGTVWNSSAEAVATVDQNGIVTGVAAGTATITVTVNGQKSATCVVTVLPKMTGIKLSTNALTIKVDSTVELTYTVQPEGATVKKEEWSSSDENVATVMFDGIGLVTGEEAGTALIILKVSGVNGQFTDTCNVTVEKPVLLPGKFSVSATRQVQFTNGNLYWDGSAFKLESGQTAYPTEWSTSHVSHFYWSKTASAAYAEIYSDSEKTATDTFFCGEANAMTIGGQSGLYALSSAEWTYLLSSTSSGGRGDGDSKFKIDVTVNGVAKCLVIAPDGYTGTIASSYTAAEWSTAESAGLVCFPAAGYRDGSNLVNAGSTGFYWSSTMSGYSEDFVYGLFFYDRYVTPSSDGVRNAGYSVRLVSSVSN